MVEELRPNNYVELRDKFECGCNDDCLKCPAYISVRKECVFIAEQKWKKWNMERRQKEEYE